MFLDQMSDDFEYTRDRLLDELSEDEQDEYRGNCKDHLFEVSIRVTSLVPEILEYLCTLYGGAAVIIDTEVLLPALPHSELPAKGDFLLGCYWVLSKTRLNILDYSQCLKNPIQPDERDHYLAALQYSARELIGFHREFPLWPWGGGNPFRE